MKDLLDRIHWPAAVLLAVTVIAGSVAPIAFLVLVPERVQDKILGLPWETLLAVGVPAVVAAVASVRNAFVGPVVAPRGSRPTSLPPAPKEGGFADVDVLMWIVALAGAVFAALSLHGAR